MGIGSDLKDFGRDIEDNLKDKFIDPITDFVFDEIVDPITETAMPISFDETIMMGFGIGMQFTGAVSQVSDLLSEFNDLVLESRRLGVSNVNTGSGSSSGYSSIQESQVRFGKRIIYGTARVIPDIVFANTSTVDRSSAESYPLPKEAKLNLVLAMCSHEIEGLHQLLVNKIPVNEKNQQYGRYAEGYLASKNTKLVKTILGQGRFELHRVLNWFHVHPGSDNQSYDYLLSTECPHQWTTAHRLRGIAYIYIQLVYDAIIFAGALPKFEAVVNGKKLYDPRDESTVFTDNWALVVRDFLTSTEYGLGASEDEINDASVSTAADICDELVTVPSTPGQTASTTTQKKYTVNGWFEIKEKPIDLLEELMRTGSGSIAFIQGEYHIFAGKIESSVGSMDESDLASDLQVVTSENATKSFNAVRGRFTKITALSSIADEYAPAEYPEIISATYEAEDNDIRTYETVDYKFVTDQFLAQRLSSNYLNDSRLKTTVTAMFKYTALAYTVWDIVTLSIADLGWSSKLFRVMKVSLGSNGVKLTLKEVGSTQYDWNYASEDNSLSIADVLTLPDYSTVDAPVSLSISEELYTNNTEGKGVQTRLTMLWSSTSGQQVDYEVSWKLSTEEDTEYKSVGTTTVESFVFNDVASGLTDFRIRAKNVFGIYSDYSTLTHDVAGLTALPSDVTNFSLKPLGNQAHLSWDRVTDVDVINGGFIKIKHSSGLSGQDWLTGIFIVDSLTGSASDVVVPLRDGTYMIKAVDSLGNYSENEAVIVTNMTRLNDLNLVETLTESTAFSGTKTDCEVVSNVLSLNSYSFDFASEDGVDVFISEDGVDALVDEGESTSRVMPSGTYEFTNDTNLGGVFDCRITVNMTALNVIAGSNIDDVVENIDSWSDFDNPVTVTGDANAVLEMRVTEDDPTGSPTWGSWQPVFVADKRLWGAEFRLQLYSDTQVDVEVSALSVTVDMPDRIEKSRNITSNAGSVKSIAFDSSFKAIPAIGITGNSLSQGDYWAITNQSVSGFDAEFFDSGAVSRARNFDWNAVGYGREI